MLLLFIIFEATGQGRNSPTSNQCPPTHYVFKGLFSASSKRFFEMFVIQKSGFSSRYDRIQRLDSSWEY